MFTYYTYVDNLHTHPRDLEELIDGLLYLDAKSYAQKKEIDQRRPGK